MIRQEAQPIAVSANVNADFSIQFSDPIEVLIQSIHSAAPPTAPAGPFGSAASTHEFPGGFTSGVIGEWGEDLVHQDLLPVLVNSHLDSLCLDSLSRLLIASGRSPLIITSAFGPARSLAVQLDPLAFGSMLTHTQTPVLKGQLMTSRSSVSDGSRLPPGRLEAVCHEAQLDPICRR